MTDHLKGNPDFPANPEEKAGYRLDFSDNFQGTGLATDKWFPHYLPQWSSREKTRARYSFQNDHLQLHINDQEPWSTEYNGNIRVSNMQTGCFSGPVGSNRGQHPFQDDLIVREAQPAVRLYTPTYGFFEVRLKAVPVAGYLSALWMIGFEEKPEQSAEICICEVFGENVDLESKIGYGVHPFNDPDITDEFYEDTFSIDASNFHIYAVDWTPSYIDFYLDNEKIRTIRQSPGYAMQFMLNVYELPDALTPESRDTPFPKTMTVDYVRGYKRMSAGDELT